MEKPQLQPVTDVQPLSDSALDAFWTSINLDAATLSSTPVHEPASTTLNPNALLPLLQTPTHDAQASWNAATAAAIAAHAAEHAVVPSLRAFSESTLPQLDHAADTLEKLATTLETAENAALSLRDHATRSAQTADATERALAHLSGFIDQLLIDPALIRHIVDGRVGEPRYGECLAELSKKVALFELDDIRSCVAYPEVRLVLDKLVDTAVSRVRTFLIDKMELLKRPNTNVNIVKESVLLPHRALVDFVELHAPNVFREVKNSYVETMSRTYYVLFRRYAAGLLTMKEMLPAESTDTLVGSLSPERPSIWGGSKERAMRSAGVTQFALGERLAVLRDVEGPAIVLATAVDNKERFFYEQIHRSLGKMLSETCASEHLFCENFFGEGGGRMFDVFFRRIVGFLLEAVKAHTAPTRDTIGVLLALKVNEAQRSSMQNRKIMDLSDFFIQVDILLKPKFKKLLRDNVASIADASVAIAKTATRSDGDSGPHLVTRRFAEFTSSLLAIARFGTPDDSILEGLRRLRTEYNGFLNAVSTLFTRPKLRYVFLVNNIDFVLSMFRRHNVSVTEDYRFFAELQELHTAAYIEQEVADHFPDIVSFVRQFERTAKAASAGATGANKRPFPSDERVGAVLRQFAANWRLGVQHLQDNVMREFPNYDLGAELTRSLFARIVAYHKRCEVAINAEYTSLRGELVTSTEIVYELRQRTTNRPS